jgi:hypothetical protein
VCLEEFSNYALIAIFNEGSEKLKKKIQKSNNKNIGGERRNLPLCYSSIKRKEKTQVKLKLPEYIITFL